VVSVCSHFRESKRISQRIDFKMGLLLPTLLPAKIADVETPALPKQIFQLFQRERRIKVLR